MKLDDTDKIIIVLTSLALNAPSTYTIAWSKEDPEKRKHYPLLMCGLGASGITLVGALANKDKLVWLGLLGSIGLFTYTIFIYKEPWTSFLKLPQNGGEMPGPQFEYANKTFGMPAD